MNLFKNRDFGMIFSDTFSFYKQQFKKLYSGLIKLIWMPLILFVASLFVVNRVMDFSSIDQIDDLDEIIRGNVNMLWIVALALLVLIISASLLSVFTYSYTVVYVLLYRDYKDNFEYKDIIGTMRAKAGKIAKYFFATLGFGVLLFVILTGLIVLMVAAVANSNEFLIIILILFFIFLIFAMLVLVPYVSLSLHNGFIEYLSTEGEGLFACFGAGFRITRSNLLKNVGSYLVMMILVQIVSGFIVAIPSYLILFSAMMTGTSDSEMMQSMLLYYVVNIGLNVIVSTLTLPLLQTNMSIIYFSNLEQSEHIQSFSEIDEIGK